MKLFDSIRKKWLQHRIYKYSLKSQDALSKSKHFLNLSKRYEAIAQGKCKMFGSGDDSQKRDIKLSSKYAIKSDHYKHLSDFYLNKQLLLEKPLCLTNEITSEKQLYVHLGNNVVTFRKIRKV